MAEKENGRGAAHPSSNNPDEREQSPLLPVHWRPHPIIGGMAALAIIV